jgi:hypothetical protein
MDLATPDDIQAGKVWYYEAQGFCKSMAEIYNITVEQAAGIMSVFSPQVSYSVNKMMVKSFLDSNGKARITMQERCNKAKRILKLTSYEDILGAISVRENSGLKTRAFYASIVDPGNTDFVVVDRHQLAASIQRPDNTTPLDNAKMSLTPLQYNFLAECTRDVARKVEMPFSSVQAIIWICYRNCRGLFQHKPNEFELPSYMEANPF